MKQKTPLRHFLAGWRSIFAVLNLKQQTIQYE